MDQRPDLLLAKRGGWIEILRVPALLFGGVARARGAFYARGLLPSYDVGVPVISVGNLSAGGTGKTPMIVWLAKELASRKRKVGIVSRGYGSAAGAPNDEALMLSEILPDVPHLQNPDRVAAATELGERGIDVVLVDDGFQHRRLARDVDLVLMDATRPFGLPAMGDNGKPVQAMLPRGLMREPLSALKRADAVVITRADAVPEETVRELEALVQRHAPGCPVALAAHAPVRLRSVSSGGERVRPVEDLAGLEVDLFSGIGNPAAFERTASKLGAIIHSHRAFGDHHAFAPGDLDGLGVDRPALTTAKDAARLLGANPGAEEDHGVCEVPPDLCVLDVELIVARGRSILEALVDSLPESRAQRERAAIHEGLHG